MASGPGPSCRCALACSAFALASKPAALHRGEVDHAAHGHVPWLHKAILPAGTRTCTGRIAAGLPADSQVKTTSGTSAVPRGLPALVVLLLWYESPSVPAWLPLQVPRRDFQHES